MEIPDDIRLAGGVPVTERRYVGAHGSTTQPSETSRDIPVAVRRAAIAIALFAFAARVAALVLFPEYVEMLQRQKELRNTAISLASTGDFANPFSEPTGKTAHLAPLGPFIISLIYRGFGITHRAEVVRGLACAAVSATVCGMTLLLAFQLGFERRVQLLAGFLAAIAPTGLQFCSDLIETDAGLGTLFFICALLAFPWKPGERREGVRAILFGAASGLAILSYQSLLTPVIGVLLCAVVLHRRMHFSLVAAIVVCLVILPWSLRNRFVFHEWVLVRSNFGLEFRLAQHPKGDQLGETLPLIHPYANARTLSLLRQAGEPAVYRGLLHDGLEWIRQNPKLFVQRTVLRIVLFWIPLGAGIHRTLASLVCTVAAFCGVKTLMRTDQRTSLTIASIWLTYPLVYYLVPGYMRYRQPIEFTIYLMAALEIIAILDALRTRQSFDRLPGVPGGIENIARG